MYCATVLCLCQIYISIISNPASDIAASNKVYSPFPYARRYGILPFHLRITWYWKPPRTQTMLGVTTHISAPKRNTD